MNIVILSGNLVRDFDLKKGVAKSCIAVSKKEGSDFIELVAFNGTADICAKLGKKGMPVIVEGSWNTNKSEGKVYHSCIIHTIQVFGKKSNEKNDEEYVEEEEETFVDEDIDTNDTLPF